MKKITGIKNVCGLTKALYPYCGMYLQVVIDKVTDMQEAVKQFNYIVTIAVDNISFLLEGV